MMIGSATSWIIVVFGTLVLSRSTWTATIDEDELGTDSKNVANDEKDHIAPLENRPKIHSDDIDEMLSAVNVERRQAKNFRGDLGKRTRGSKTSGNSRLRPDLGKRSTSPSAAGSASRTNGLRQKRRPILGERAAARDELYFRWLPDFRPASTDDQQRIDNGDAIIPSDQLFVGDQREDADEHSDTKRARGSSSFRGDLGKRASFVGLDVLDESSLTDPDDGVADHVDGDLSKRGKSSFRGDLGKRTVDALLDKQPVEAIDKRAKSASSKLRGDLGKRRASSGDYNQPLDHVLDHVSSSLAKKRAQSKSLRGDLG